MPVALLKVIDITERNSAVLALVENIQRQDLSFFEEAIAIAKLIDFYGMTQEDAAIKLGKKQSTISNKLRLLRLSPREMTLISEAGLTERHARALLRISDEKTRLSVIEKVITSGLNVEKTEKLIENAKQVLLRAEEKNEDKHAVWVKIEKATSEEEYISIVEEGTLSPVTKLKLKEIL